MYKYSVKISKCFLNFLAFLICIKAENDASCNLSLYVFLILQVKWLPVTQTSLMRKWMRYVYRVCFCFLSLEFTITLCPIRLFWGKSTAQGHFSVLTYTLKFSLSWTKAIVSLFKMSCKLKWLCLTLIVLAQFLQSRTQILDPVFCSLRWVHMKNITIRI